MSLTVPVSEIVENTTNALLAAHKSWTRIPLGHVASILNGAAFKSSLFSKAEGRPLVRIRDVGKSSTDCFYNGDFDDKYAVETGDLLVGMDGEFRASRWTGPPALLNQRVCKITLTTGCYEPGFLDIVLPAYLDAIREQTSSVTVTHLSSRDIAGIPLPLPPLAEQKRIVAKVEELLGRVQAARERLAKVPALLKRFRQAVLAAACSGQLTEEWREDTGSGEGSETELPQGWKRIALRELCHGFQYGSSRKSDPAGAIPVLRMGNIQEGRIDWSDLVFTSDKDEIEKYRLAPGTVLFNRTNSPELVGKTGIYLGERPAIFAGYLVRVLHGPRLNPQYLNYCLNDPKFKEYCATVKTDGVSQSNINAQKLASFEIPWCDVNEQREIVRRVEGLFALADKIEGRVNAATARVEKITQAILAKAFRGELVPTEAELARQEGRPYEPAAALLARIRAQREKDQAGQRTRSVPNARRSQGTAPASRKPRTTRRK